MVVLGLTPFEIVFQSISGRLPESGRKKRDMIEERKMSKQPQSAPTTRAVSLALLSSEVVGLRGTGSLPSTIAPGPSQYIVPFGNTQPTCMPLSGQFMCIEGRVLVHQTFGNTKPIRMPLSLHFMYIEGRVLVHQTDRYQVSLKL